MGKHEPVQEGLPVLSPSAVGPIGPRLPVCLISFLCSRLPHLKRLLSTGLVKDQCGEGNSLVLWLTVVAMLAFPCCVSVCVSVCVLGGGGVVVYRRSWFIAFLLCQASPLLFEQRGKALKDDCWDICVVRLRHLYKSCPLCCLCLKI